jgi:hypothetical protein
MIPIEKAGEVLKEFRLFKEEMAELSADWMLVMEEETVLLAEEMEEKIVVAALTLAVFSACRA